MAYELDALALNTPEPITTDTSLHFEPWTTDDGVLMPANADARCGKPYPPYLSAIPEQEADAYCWGHETEDAIEEAVAEATADLADQLRIAEEEIAKHTNGEMGQYYVEIQRRLDATTSALEQLTCFGGPLEALARGMHEWDMLTLREDGHGSAVADAPWARRVAAQALVALARHNAEVAAYVESRAAWGTDLTNPLRAVDRPAPSKDV